MVGEVRALWVRGRLTGSFTRTYVLVQDDIRAGLRVLVPDDRGAGLRVLVQDGIGEGLPAEALGGEAESGHEEPAMRAFEFTRGYSAHDLRYGQEESAFVVDGRKNVAGPDLAIGCSWMRQW